MSRRAPASRRPLVPLVALAVVAALGLVAAAKPRPTPKRAAKGATARPAPPRRSGCAKDTDCKGDRICVRGACDEPPRATPPDGGVGALGPPVVPTVTLPGASPLFHVDWAHSGRSRYRAPAQAPTEIARIATAGAVVSAPAIADDGTAFFGSHDRRVRAVTPSGIVRWSVTTGDLVWSAPALGPGGVVYVGSDDDRLYALDAGSGAVRWSFTAGPCRATRVGPEGARCDVDGVTVGPDGTIYLVADGLYALAPDGKPRFRFPLRTHCAGAPAIGPDGTVHVGCQDGALYAVAADGKKRWEYRTPGDLDSTPAVGADGTVYFGSDDHKLYAVAPGGTLRFAVQTGGDVRSSPALASDGTIYVGSFDGGLYAVRPDGTVAWSFRAADRILSSPLIDADGVVLFGSQDDRLYAVRPDGTLGWSVLLGGDVDGTPALGPDGTIYVGADDGALHLLR